MASFVIVKRWIDTRIFVPVDIPVSLTPGHIRTGPFRINVEQGYSIWIDFDQSTYFNPMCSSYSNLKTTWTLYRDGRVQTQWDAPVLQDGYLEGFAATKGFYDLDVHVLADASCLNANRPRLRVVTSRDNDSFCAGVLLWSCAAFVVVGLSLVILGRRGVVFRELEQPAVVPNTPTLGQNCQWAQRLPLRRQFSSPPAFALLAVPVLVFLIIIFMVILQPYPARGLYVKVLRPNPLAATDPLSNPVVVQILDAGLGVTPELYINSKPTSWNSFSDDLKNELKLRPKWVVYVQADPVLPWADIVNAINLAKGLHADVVLLTIQPTIQPRGVRTKAKIQK
jgi:biopolymer transport protein ExbD